MSRNRQATHNQFAVSANIRESALNAHAELDTLMLIQLEEMAKVELRRETNADEATGYEEATEAYSLGYTGAYDISFKRGQPQHFAFLLAYALGGIASPVAAGTTGYKHVFTPMEGFLDNSRSNPTFTVAQRYGQIMKRRLISNFVKSVKVNLAKDSWAAISASIGCTGKFDSNIVKESVVDGEDTTSLTLAANGVYGATATERLESIDFVRCTMAGGEKVYCDVSAVSGATPAVLTITAAGVGVTDRTFEVCYLPASPDDWCTFPAKVAEPPLRTTDFSVNIGGKWNGTAIVGGKTVQGEIDSIDWTLTNDGLEPEFVPGPDPGCASRAIRRSRTQSINFNRDFMDFLLQQLAIDNEDIAIKAVAEGIEFESGHKYTVQLVWPKCRVLVPTLSVNNKLMAENTTISVFQDATYGSVIATVINKVAKYAAIS